MKTFGIIALIVSLVCQAKADTVVINPITTGGETPAIYTTTTTSPGEMSTSGTIIVNGE